MRASLEHPEVQVVAVNDPFIDLTYMVLKAFNIVCPSLALKLLRKVDAMMLHKLAFSFLVSPWKESVFVVCLI